MKHSNRNPPRAKSFLVVLYRNPGGFLNISKTEDLGGLTIGPRALDRIEANSPSEALGFFEISDRCWTPYYLAARGVVTLRDEAFAVRSTNSEGFYGHLGLA